MFHSWFVRSRLISSLGVLLGCGFAAWQASGCDLIDGLSVVHLGDSGMDKWTVNSVSQLYSQAFWYRVGEQGGQTSVNSLTLVSSSQPNAKTYTVERANHQFDLSTTYSLADRPGGNGFSRITETLTFHNLKESSYTLHLFQFVDMDLVGAPAGDVVQLSGSAGAFSGATQYKGNTLFTETVSSLASHGLVTLDESLIPLLNNGAPLTPSGATGPLGLGDAKFLLEWDIALGSKGSYSLTIQKEITALSVQPVPEPSSIALVGIGALALFCRRYRNSMLSK